MREYSNSVLILRAVPEEKSNMLLDFLEDNKIDYEFTDVEVFTKDERSEEEQYQDWLSEQADLHNDEVKMGIE